MRKGKSRKGLCSGIKSNLIFLFRILFFFFIFIDADGSFQLILTLNALGRGIDIDLCMLLTQARFAASCLNIPCPITITNPILLERMVKALSARNADRIRDRNGRVVDAVGVDVLTIPSRQALLSYLSTFPLMSSKRCDARDWAEAHRIVMAHGQRTTEGTLPLRELKSGINSRGVKFYWSHLAL